MFYHLFSSPKQKTITKEASPSTQEAPLEDEIDALAYRVISGDPAPIEKILEGLSALMLTDWGMPMP
jgi:hypothetical protein